MSNESPDLKQLDEQIARLLRTRNEEVERLSDSGAMEPYHEERSRLAALDSDPSLTDVLLHLASQSRQRVRPKQISFLGPIYSYSHLAAIKYFGEGVDFAPVASIPAVFDAVHRGDAHSGLVPIENSTDGGVVDTLGMFVRRHMQICGEVLLPIHHNLLASGTRDQIKAIHSKPQALSQCRGWLQANFPAAQLVEVGSTTAAAESASKDTSVAAVASLPAGRAYGLSLIAKDIEDNSDNVTRFAVLGREETEPTGTDKTSLLFQVEHKPGALAEAMTLFREAELNLTWIESFPSPGTRSEYLFFVELSGHRADPPVASAIEKLTAMTHRLDILGSYPMATEV